MSPSRSALIFTTRGCSDKVTSASSSSGVNQGGLWSFLRLRILGPYLCWSSMAWRGAWCCRATSRFRWAANITCLCGTTTTQRETSGAPDTPHLSPCWTVRDCSDSSSCWYEIISYLFPSSLLNTCWAYKTCGNSFVHGFFPTVSKITLLCHLESFFKATWKSLPLLVKIIHKSRLRYYGKHGQKIDFPYQVRSELMLCSSFGVHCCLTVYFNNFMHVCCSGVLWGCWPEWDNVARALEWTLSRVLPKIECWHSAVPSKLHPEAELLKSFPPSNGPPQNEDL